MKTPHVDDNPRIAPEAPATGAAPSGDRSLGTRLKGALPRLLVAHLVAYPLAFAWAVAAIPPAIFVIPDKVILTEEASVISQKVLHNLLWPTIFVAVVAHAIAVPWGFVRDDARPRARRLYWILVAVLFGTALLVGGSTWLWLVTR